MIEVRVQQGGFDPGRELDALGRAGAVASFIGSVRADDGVTRLEIEHYPAMTDAVLRDLAAEAAASWGADAITLVHRFGMLAAGERIVFVGAASAHRAAALGCVGFLIDRLKVAAPFWKKEHLADGAARWVEARPEDEARAAGTLCV